MVPTSWFTVISLSRSDVYKRQQPEHLALTQTFAANPYPDVLGRERTGRVFPYRSLYKSAGILAIGSDCPVVDNDPFLEIFRAVTRVHNDNMPAGGWNPSEKLTLSEVLKFYTYGSAYGVMREDELGTLSPGKFADIAVIDKDPVSYTHLDVYKRQATDCAQLYPFLWFATAFSAKFPMIVIPSFRIFLPVIFLHILRLPRPVKGNESLPSRRPAHRAPVLWSVGSHRPRSWNCKT